MQSWMWLIVVALLGLFVRNIIEGYREVEARYCTNCGTKGKPVKQMGGSFFIELLLWIAFIVPGLIYSIWRYTTIAHVCPKCGWKPMIPLDTPKAKEALG